MDGVLPLNGLCSEGHELSARSDRLSSPSPFIEFSGQ